MSGRDFARKEFCQEGILSGRDFVRKGFCQGGILSGRNFVRKGFCQEGILSGREGILSGRNFVRQEFCQEGILPGSGLCQPGSGLCQEAGSARKESQLWVLLLSTFFFWGTGGESALELCVLSSSFWRTRTLLVMARAPMWPLWKTQFVQCLCCRISRIQSPMKPAVLRQRRRLASRPRVNSVAFAMNCVPFGGAASVYAFARTAMALQRILTQVFWVVITNYLDDYVPFPDVALTSVSEKVIRTVFHVLGFVLSTNPKKDHPFAETFTALGVEFLLHDTPTSLAVRNTAARCEELLALLHEILHSDCVTARQLQSLRSVYGRVGVCMIKQMSVVEGFTQTSPLPPALRVSIQAMIHRLQHNPPVEVPMLQKEPWHVFTDGAQEGEGDQARTSMVGVELAGD